MKKQPNPDADAFEKRICRLRGNDRMEAYCLHHRLEVASQLARGPDVKRSTHWSFEYCDREALLDSFLRGRGV